MLESLDQFGRKLSDSGLLSKQQLDDFCDSLPGEQRPSKPDELGRTLVERNLITEFQLTEVASEDPEPLVIGDYVIQEKIGEGGMGTVFKAQHRLMKRTVAVKKMTAAIGEDDSALKRFEREVEISASLNHINVVAALDAREKNGTHYLIMEYVPGQALSQIVQDRGPLPVDVALGYIIQAATGCAHAHNRGIIHRDIKPSNIVIGSDDVVKILDMGLARLDLPQRESLLATKNPLTSAGIIIGTLDYMSPEQALDSHGVDHRTDIYSLGCTLHFLLTGQPVYSGCSPMEKLVAHREQPVPSLSSARMGVSQELDDVFRRMVAKQANDRFVTMDQVIDALQSCRRSADGAVISEPSIQRSVPPVDPSTEAPSPVTVAESPQMVSEPAPLQPQITAQSLNQHNATAQVAPASASGRLARFKRAPLIFVCRVLAAVIGGFVGYEIGAIFAALPGAVGSVFFVWVGWRVGGGYAWMFAWSQGWSPVPPEVKAGPLFAMSKLKEHALAIAVGGIVGPAIGLVGVWAGMYAGVAVLAVTHHLQVQKQAGQ